MRFFLICALIALSGIATVTSKENLVLLQAVWRHGDRSPTDTYPNDPMKESDYHLGWGQLTATGMAQHIDLGRRLRDQYINNVNNEDFTFDLNPTFSNSHQIYVRATDVNRTIISAMSNMIGFYDMVESGVAGVDFPNITAWPTGFIPIAVHTTVPYDFDHVGNPDAECKLQHQVWKEIEKSDLYKNTTEVNKDLLAYLSKNSGMEVTLSNLWLISDSLFIQNVTFGASGWPTWINDTLYEDVYALNDIVQDWQDGLSLNGLKANGQDASALIKQCRGGSLVWSILNHMNAKIECSKPNATASRECNWMNPLKYYVYSAHDTTLSALLTSLGARQDLTKDRYPHYSAATTFELIEEDNEYFVRARYWYPNSAAPVDHNITVQVEHNTTFTRDIVGCQNITGDRCPLKSILVSMQAVLPPNGLTIEKYCDLGLEQFNPATATPKPKAASTSTANLFTLILAAVASYFFATGISKLW